MMWIYVNFFFIFVEWFWNATKRPMRSSRRCNNRTQNMDEPHDLRNQVQLDWCSFHWNSYLNRFMWFNSLLVKWFTTKDQCRSPSPLVAGRTASGTMCPWLSTWPCPCVKLQESTRRDFRPMLAREKSAKLGPDLWLLLLWFLWKSLWWLLYFSVNCNQY